MICYHLATLTFLYKTYDKFKTKAEAHGHVKRDGSCFTEVGHLRVAT